MDAETTTTEVEYVLTIEGEQHPFPSIDTFDNDEWQIVWDESGLGMDDFAMVPVDDPDHDVKAAERSRKLGHPGLFRALMHIAYRRAHPDAKDVFIRKLIGKQRPTAATTAVEVEVEQDPPTLTESASRTDGSSPNGSSESSDSSRASFGGSAIGSPASSAGQDALPETTGTFA